MRTLSDHEVLTGTAFMPILPFICDDDSNLEAVVSRTAENGGRFVLAAGLTMSGTQSVYFLEALKRRKPELVEKYEQFYRGTYSPPDAKYVGKVALKVKGLCMKFGILDRMPRYIPVGSLAANNRIAEEIFSRCRQIEIEGAPSYKIWAYRRAGWTVDELDCDIVALYERSGLRGLRALPNIGPSLASLIAEKLRKASMADELGLLPGSE